MQTTLANDRPVAPVNAVNIPVPDEPPGLGPGDVLVVEELPQRPQRFGREFSRCG